MVTEGIVLGHKISHTGLEVGPAKIDVVSKLPPPSDLKPLRSFYGHDGFYCRFIKGFSQLTKPLCNLLGANQPYNFDEKCHQAFQTLKDVMALVPILITPYWSQPFQLMCDKSDVAVGTILDQKCNAPKFKIFWKNIQLLCLWIVA
ncbi:hypothetical protein IC582_016147 [Cucumis melo]